MDYCVDMGRFTNFLKLCITCTLCTHNKQSTLATVHYCTQLVHDIPLPLTIRLTHCACPPPLVIAEIRPVHLSSSRCVPPAEPFKELFLTTLSRRLGMLGYVMVLQQNKIIFNILWSKNICACPCIISSHDNTLLPLVLLTPPPLPDV